MHVSQAWHDKPILLTEATDDLPFDDFQLVDLAGILAVVGQVVLVRRTPATLGTVWWSWIITLTNRDESVARISGIWSNRS